MKTSSPQAAYRRVPILRPGAFTDSEGRPVSFSAAQLALIADGYDPHYHSAPVNIDHAEYGPALGAVSDLVFDGEQLCADLVNVPAPVADAIDAGRFPFRSAEVYADLDGRGPYLRALALLGARPPAVKGLPPFPAREQRTAIRPPAMEQTGGAMNTYLEPTTRPRPRTIHIQTEVHMSEAVHDQPAAATVEQPAPSSEATRLAEENHRLAEEIRRLKNDERRRGVACFLSELRGGGRLTPAMERAGLEEALLACEEQPLAVELADGKQVQLGELLRDVLRSLPAYPGLDGELAGESEQQLAHLSDQEREIAAQLGLSEQEFAEIKQAS